MVNKAVIIWRLEF